VKFGFEGGRAKNAYNYLVNNDITAVYNNGLPTQAIVYNTPLAYSSEIRDAAAFVQDAWHVSKRLTVNLGLRYDRFRSYNPAQSSPATGTYVSLFGARTFPQSPDTVCWNNFSPRLGAAFDITGKGRSVIRAAFSRFYRMEGAELSSAVNPNTFSS
jgi:outer membrane receptor protein involved in Fe transport